MTISSLVFSGTGCNCVFSCCPRLLSSRPHCHFPPQVLSSFLPYRKFSLLFYLTIISRTGLHTIFDDSFVCATWLMLTWDVTHASVWERHDSLIPKTWFMSIVVTSTVFDKHCECIAQKFTYLERLPPLAIHLLLLSQCVLTRHRDKKISQIYILHRELEQGSVRKKIN